MLVCRLAMLQTQNDGCSSCSSCRTLPANGRPGLNDAGTEANEGKEEGWKSCLSAQAVSPHFVSFVPFCSKTESERMDARQKWLSSRMRPWELRPSHLAAPDRFPAVFAREVKMTRTIVLLMLCLSWSAALADDASRSAPVEQPELQNELLRRTKIDQQVRQEQIKWMKDHGPKGVANLANPAALDEAEAAEFAKLAAKMKAVDAENTKWLHEVVERHGWPGRSLVGKDGAKAAWLLVQHADADPKFQRFCLDRMAELPEGEVSPANAAYLTDRVLLAEGKKQRYGTQFIFVDGKPQVRPLEDEANVDHRRAEVGLPPLADYAKVIEEQFGARSDK